MGFESYINTIPAVRQTNIIKMTHSWIHGGHQEDLFSTEGDMHLYPAACGEMESHQHYISCYAPPMVLQKKRCMRDLYKTLQKIKTATPIARALRYIIQYVIDESEPFPRRHSPSPIQDMVFQEWREQK